MRALPWLLVAVLFLPAPAFPDAPVEVDKGRLDIYARDRLLGTEDFLIERSGDSLNVWAATFLMIPGAAGPDSLAKRMTMRLDAFDFDLRMYDSVQKFRGSTLSRGVKPYDTTYSVFRQLDGAGQGDYYARPPGRLFVMDGQIFTSFAVICRNLQGRMFEKWPLWMLMLSGRDTLLQADATYEGADTLRWGARRVQVRKLSIGDAQTRYLLWMTADGRMLRLEQPESGLRVLREPPPVKRARKKT